MSDFVLSIIPTDPRWQPTREAGARVRAIVEGLAPEADEIEVAWHDKIAAVDCGENLERITCPVCRGSIETGWYMDLLEDNAGEGFDDLAIAAPCCGGATTLDALEYDWPLGFARFEIAVWNDLWEPLEPETLAALEAALGHEVRLVHAHI